MSKVRLGDRRTVILPVATVKRLGLTVGEELEIVEGDRAILLVLRKHIPKDQEWYHTPAWQQMMQEAFKDLAHGRMAGPFKTVEELMHDLRS